MESRHLTTSSASFFSNQNPDEQKLPEVDMDEVAKNFDEWMTFYTGHNGSDNEELIEWLDPDTGNGKQYVKTYEQFCKLARILSHIGYHTNPPPAESDFNRAMGYDKFEKKRE